MWLLAGKEELERFGRSLRSAYFDAWDLLLGNYRAYKPGPFSDPLCPALGQPDYRVSLDRTPDEENVAAIALLRLIRRAYDLLALAYEVENGVLTLDLYLGLPTEALEEALREIGSLDIRELQKEVKELLKGGGFIIPDHRGRLINATPEELDAVLKPRLLKPIEV